MNDTRGETSRDGNKTVVPIHALRRSSQRMGGPAPEWVQIFPYPTYIGELDGKKKTWITDDISQQSCVDYFNLRGNDLVFDYEHLSDKDVEAPAAGRIVELRSAGAKGLLGRVEWTARARSQIESGDYYYDSPSFFWSREDDRIYGLRHVALTNNPASWNRPHITDHSAQEFFSIERTSQARGMARPQLVCAVVQSNKERRKGMTLNSIVEGFRGVLARSASVSGKDLRADVARVMEAIPDTDDALFAEADHAATESAHTFAQLVGAEPSVDVASQGAQLKSISLALGVETNDPRELALAVMSLKSNSVPVERVRELESKLAAAESRGPEERIAIEVARQRSAGKQITPAFEAELLRVARSDVELALSSLDGLQVTSLDLTTQADAPAPSVDRIEIVRQRKQTASDRVPGGASKAMQVSASVFEDTMAIASEKGITYDEANDLRIALSRAA